MSLAVYDTLKGEKRAFETIEPGKVGMYVCGVTPYARCYLGHARCYVAWDIVYRYLRFAGYEVTYVRNFTDVDDKIINKANEMGMDPLALAEENIQAFYSDMDALGIARPQHEPRVSTSIAEIVALVQALEDKGYAYNVDGDVYYEVAKFDGYGKLSKRNIDSLMAGARVDVDERKRSPMDFALWKSAKPGEIKWPSPWGEGRPGWHIECSAMSVNALGNTFDIHCGGRDLIFPHHENEIAQSEGASGCHYVNYWMHNGFININEEKMSKSLGNCFNIGDITERYEPLVLRFLFLSGTHYRNPINFNDAMLDEAAARISYFYETLRKAEDFVAAHLEDHDGVLPNADFIDGLEAQFRDAMNDDFHVVRALDPIGEAFKTLNDLASTRKKGQIPAAAASASKLLDIIRRIDAVLNLFSEDAETYLRKHRVKAALRKEISVEWLEKRISERIAARTAREWALADEIRNELEGQGVILMDHPGGTDWSIEEVRASEEASE
jgi:cysteinyl-tRNA synthetase